MTMRCGPGSQASGGVCQHIALLERSPAGVGTREAIEIYRRWLGLILHVDTYRRAAALPGLTFTTDLSV